MVVADFFKGVSSLCLKAFEKSIKIAPGVVVCAIIALAATFISDHHGGPAILYALLFGTALNCLSEEGRCVEGVEYSSRSILRFGVALLGVRITVDQVAALGIGPVVMAMASVVMTILVGVLLARMLGLHRDMGLLTGGAVAICGASAALALSTVIPRSENSERNTILTVVGVTTLSTAAMVLYPLLSSVLRFTDETAGVLLGGTIHDVAQVVGAGYMISDEAGDVATFVKLMRVAMLVPVVAFFIFLFRNDKSNKGSGKALHFPGFLVAFVILVTINSLGVIPTGVTNIMTDLSRWCLVIAIAGLGIKTSLKKLAVVGWRPIILIVFETFFILGFVLAFIALGVF